MRMTTNTEYLEINGERVADTLRGASETMNRLQGDVVLDFSSVQRVDPNALRALKELAGIADGKAVKVGLRNVNVDVYKVLKLVKLTSRFSFLT